MVGVRARAPELVKLVYPKIGWQGRSRGGLMYDRTQEAPDAPLSFFQLAHGLCEPPGLRLMVSRAGSMVGACWSVLGAWWSVLGAWWSMLWACCGCMLGACWNVVKAFNREFARSGRRSRATICGASRWIGRECLCGVNHSKRKASTRVELYTTKLVGGCSQGNSRHTAPGGRYVNISV